MEILHSSLFDIKNLFFRIKTVSWIHNKFVMDFQKERHPHAKVLQIDSLIFKQIIKISFNNAPKTEQILKV